MSISMTKSSVTVFNQMLGSMSVWIDKAEAFCTSRKIAETTLPNTRLAADMLPLARQVQIACDFAKNAVARLAGVEPIKFEDTETTLPQLKDRIARTLAYVNSIPTKDIEAGLAREITFPMGPDRSGSMVGADYLSHYAMQNFYFHTTMTYAILRHCGVELGKRDFLGAVPGLKAV